MATRVRQATAEPTQRGGGNELPPYEKPSFPLNPAAQRALEQLTRTHNLNKLDDGLAEAQAALTTTAGEINDRLYQKEQAAKKRRTQREQSSSGGAEDEDGIERSLEEFRSKVERMTQRMDDSMRKMIDAQHSVQSIIESVAATTTDARANAATQASTQQARTQQYEEFMPTDPAAGTQDRPTPIEKFRSKTDDAKTKYQSHSLTTRYAEDNHYRDFRRVVHDARHPDGDAQLPHHSEWFEEGRAPAPGVTAHAQRNEDDEDDSDEDIAISRATISTTCPLTLAEFRAPLTSKKCPHSFEAEAIRSLISRSAVRDPERGNVPVNRCPVPGCSQMLALDDLHTDAVLVRKIKRQQHARELEQEEADEEEGGRRGDGPTVIDDGDDGEDVDDIIEGRSTQVKREPRTQKRAAQTPSTARGSRHAPMNVDESGDEETDGDLTMED